MTCPACNNQLNDGARFCSACGRPIFEPAAQSFQQPMQRPRNGRAIAGVCAAFAQHFGWDVVLVRLVLVAAVLFGCGTPMLAYAIAWIVIPNEPKYFNAPPPSAPITAQPAA
jgi:phage shock protein C